MMKLLIKQKSLFYITTILLIAVFSCKKDEGHLFNESPDERLNKKLEEYQQALVNAPDGWKATYIPATGGKFNFYFRFNAENRVLMYADFDTATAKNQKESSYRLKALQQPSLIFDTYSYIHLLADPDGAVNGGNDGQGLLADFEFAIDSVYTDSITLTGRINNTRLTLQKASAQEYAAWQNGDWADALSFNNLSLIENYFKALTLNGVKYEVRINPIKKTVTILWLSGSAVKEHTTSYYFVADGIVLEEPVVNGSQTINGFSNLVWNNNTMTLSVKSGILSGSIAGDVKPLKTDVTAPQRWWQSALDADGYWESVYGFHSNGVDDIFNITGLDRYYRLIYWPDYGTGADLFAPVFVDETGTRLQFQYASAPGKPTFTSDGRAIFSLLGFYTFGTYPASGPAYETLQQLLIPEGYYFIQTGETTYDMVSADDAKTWITWEF